MKKSLSKGLVLFITLCTLYTVLSTVVYAQPQLPYDLIEVPTAYPIQKGNYNLDFRIYGGTVPGGGGILGKIRLGLLDSLFLGLSLSVDNLIGSGDPSIPSGNPGVLARFRVFDEMTSKVFPTISLGFDSSNYWDKKGKGFYVVASKELPVGKMFSHVHGGVNRPVGDDIPIGFFTAYDFFFSPEFDAIVEVESGNANTNSALYISYNFGIEYNPIASLRVGLFCRNLFEIGGPVTSTREIHIGYANKLF